ncbi:MAG: hypothetical protein E7480_07695 [Ruminococcaceae bacterium]|nr:hypothetical protein [Oscillospiraceae bacterium]
MNSAYDNLLVQNNAVDQVTFEGSTDDNVINIKYIIFVIVRKWWIIAIMTVATLIIGGVYTFAIAKPVYQATSTVFMYKKSDTTNNIISDLNVGQTLLKTSIEIIKSNRIAEKAMTLVDEKIRPASAGTLLAGVYASAKEDTHILNISVTDLDPTKAAAYANAMTEAFVEDFDSIINVNGYDKISLVHIIDKAKVPSAPIKPNKLVNMLVAFLIGLILGAGIIFISEYFDDTVKTSERLKAVTGLSIIGNIMMFSDDA